MLSKKSLEFVSSGLPSLDAIIGGGYPVGSLVLILEDLAVSSYSDLFLKTFLSQGVVGSDVLFVASRDCEPTLLTKHLPGEIGGHVEEKKESDEELRIAWRYQKPDTRHVSVNQGFSFSSSLPIDSTKINYTSNENLLEEIREKLSKNELLSDQDGRVKPGPILRVAVHRLGSLFWDVDLPRLLYRLRCLAHHSKSVIVATLPDSVNKDDFSRCCELSDLCIHLEEINQSTNPLYAEYSGLVNFLRVPFLNSLSPQFIVIRDWAFKFIKKRIILERLTLPPELETSTGREQDTALSCASMNKPMSSLNF